MTDYPTLADLCPSTVRMYRLCFLCRAWASATETSSQAAYTPLPFYIGQDGLRLWMIDAC